jgi:hypothetical protein
MERITVNPHAQHCPDFISGAFHQARQLSIDAGLTANHKAAAQALADNWQGWNQQLRTAWDAQVLADEQAAEDARHIAEDETTAAKAAAVKKHPKMNIIVPGQFVPADLDIQPSAYALNRIANFEHAELWYFSDEGCADAATASQSTINNTLTLTQVGDDLTLQPLSTSRPSPRVRKDHDLTFPQFLTAYKHYLQYIIDAGWPAVNVASLNGLSTTLKMHPFRRVKHGKATLLLYQSRVRMSWHKRLKIDKGFEIHVVDNTKLNICMVEVTDTTQALEEQLVRPPSTLHPYPHLTASFLRSLRSPPLHHRPLP